MEKETASQKSSATCTRRFFSADFPSEFLTLCKSGTGQMSGIMQAEASPSGPPSYSVTNQLIPKQYPFYTRKEEIVSLSYLPRCLKTVLKSCFLDNTVRMVFCPSKGCIVLFSPLLSLFHHSKPSWTKNPVIRCRFMKSA